MQVPTQKSGRFIMRIIEAMMMPVEKHMGEAELTSDINAIKWLEMSWSCRHFNQDSLVFFRAKKRSWLQHVLFIPELFWDLTLCPCRDVLQQGPYGCGLPPWVAALSGSVNFCGLLPFDVVVVLPNLFSTRQESADELQEYRKQVVFKSG